MTKPHLYVPVKGAQQRRKLLKDLGRKPIRKRFSHSSGEVRRVIGRMFGFEPLTDLTNQERKILRRYTELTVEKFLTQLNEDAGNLLSGATKIAIGKKHLKEEDYKKLKGTSIKSMFYGTKKYGKVEYFHRSPEGGGSMGTFQVQGSRGLKSYSFDVLEEATKIYRRKQSQVRVLDVGSGTAEMLWELKRKMGTKVETHSLFVEDEPRYKTDFEHMLTAEFVPKAFHKKFDLIISQIALRYAILPHIAIRNIAESLAPNGKALIHWGEPRVSVENITKIGKEVTASFFSNYKNSKVRPQTVRLIKEEAKVRGMNIDNKEIEERIVLSFKTRPIETGINIAIWNEIVKLKTNPAFRITIQHPGIIDAPSYITIERIK
ncbi:MAG: methyltransferase domain-containing protein [archaeon]|nr:methyltransferase domain-containing protein [archaeon]